MVRQAPGVDCNKIPANMIDPVGQRMINLYPVSNASNAALGYNYTNVPVRKLNEGEFDVRIDHSFSTKDTLFARFSYDQAVSFVPGGSPGFAEQSAFASTQNITNHGRNVAISETHIFSRSQHQPVHLRLQPHFQPHLSRLATVPAQPRISGFWAQTLTAAARTHRRDCRSRPKTA